MTQGPTHDDPAILSIVDMIGDPVDPASFPRHDLRWRNDRAAATIGLDTLDDAGWIERLGRFAPFPANLPRPLALRYHGHQFGSYNADLGDGRGFLFAQRRGADGRLYDLATKGSGQTPYSRFGDGRLTLKGAVRELLATEMLAALGVETSRTFSIIETGEALYRGDEPSPTRSAVLVRMSHGHIRIGSFQRLAYLDDTAGLERLTRYALTALMGEPEDAVAAMSANDAAVRLMTLTAQATARLAASYMVAGFVHGVLNSDNINVTGESFDYGPWRFTPLWDPAFVAAYFDEAGQYAFGRQPQAIFWDAGQLAVSLRPIAESDALIAALETYAPAYEAALADRFCWRLGVAAAATPEADKALILAAERWMVDTATPIDQYFIDWHGGAVPMGDGSDAHRALAEAIAGRVTTRGKWWEQTAPQSMLIDEVEAIWSAIAERDDWAPLYAKVNAVRAMGAALA